MRGPAKVVGMTVAIDRTQKSAPGARWMSTGAAARELGMSRDSVTRWCREKLIEHTVTIGGHYRVSVEAVRARLRETLSEPTQTAQ